MYVYTMHKGALARLPMALYDEQKFNQKFALFYVAIPNLIVKNLITSTLPEIEVEVPENHVADVSRALSPFLKGMCS